MHALLKLLDSRIEGYLRTVLAGMRMPLLYWVFKSVSILLSILIYKVY